MVATLTLLYKDGETHSRHALSELAEGMEARLTPGVEMDLDSGARLGVFVLQGCRENVERAAQVILADPCIERGQLAAATEI